MYQPPSYWEAYNRPGKQYRYITDPKPYHTVRELEMDRIDRDKQLEKFKGRISTIPVKDYTKPLIKSSEMNGKVHEEERVVKKKKFEPIGNRVNRYL